MKTTTTVMVSLDTMQDLSAFYGFSDAELKRWLKDVGIEATEIKRTDSINGKGIFCPEINKYFKISSKAVELIGGYKVLKFYLENSSEEEFQKEQIQFML